MADAWACARVGTSADSVRRTLPHLVGADGARLVLRETGSPIGPPAGAVHFDARWHAGRASGDADVLLFPVSPSLCEVHVALRSSRASGLRARRLARIASELAGAVAKAAQSRTPDRRLRSERDRPAWGFRPATSSTSR